MDSGSPPNVVYGSLGSTSARVTCRQGLLGWMVVVHRLVFHVGLMGFFSLHVAVDIRPHEREACIFAIHGAVEVEHVVARACVAVFRPTCADRNGKRVKKGEATFHEGSFFSAVEDIHVL